MNFFNKLFGRTVQKISSVFKDFRELGKFNAIFHPFGRQIYKAETVRACVRVLADHTSKANPKSTDKRIERMLTYSPNIFMSGRDFLAKCRNLLEVKNTLFIMIYRNEKAQVTGFYPIPYESFRAMEYENELFIKFTFSSNAMRDMVVAWKDLAVMRKDYLMSDIAGEDNDAILDQLDLIYTTKQGIRNAVKSTANLRGIIKNTKTMIDAADVRKTRDEFVKAYMNLENEGGIAALDPSQEFTPIKMEPTVVNSAQLKEFREDVERYYGVNDDIIMSKADEKTMEAFYSSKIEPFLIGLSLELTRKVFSERELGFGAYIVFESSRLQFASNTTKLALQAMVDRGAMTPNEWRGVFNMAPVEGGDTPIRRLDTAQVEGGEQIDGGSSDES